MRDFILTFALLLTFSFSALAQINYKTKHRIQPKAPVNKYAKLKTNVIQRDCPDLAAVSIKYQKLSGGAHSGKVRITGTIKNVGKQNFVSNPRQMYVILYEVSLSGRTTIKARSSFGNIPSGRTASVSFVKSWYAGNEFPPNYRVCVSYDPDIKKDGNPRNDDCYRANNCKTRIGSEINNLFGTGS